MIPTMRVPRLNLVNKMVITGVFILFVFWGELLAQETKDELLTLDKIYSGTFRPERFLPVQWIENGKAYVRVEPSKDRKNTYELVRYDSRTNQKSVFISADQLTVGGRTLPIESFTLSADGSKVLIFNNSSRVWRSNTKGDYWVYDFNSKKLSRLGKKFKPSSLMFAKFSSDRRSVAYVHDFNLYLENFASGEVKALTSDGNGKIINGTFDWVYEEEFGKRDGFLWSPKGAFISFWQLDASEIRTFYMINNTDSIYSQMIPLQYPKVGETPSSARLGILDVEKEKKHWIALPGDPRQNYIPGMQWVDEDLLLIQQLNRKQNRLTVWKYQPSDQKISKVYSEEEPTAWVALGYPDISANGWGNNDLKLVDDRKAFLRMTETGDWRQVYKVNILTGKKTLLTPGNFDVATISGVTSDQMYFIASPKNSTQRYLYRTDLNGKGRMSRVTPTAFSGVNLYNISPDGKYAIHDHQSSRRVKTVRLVRLPGHRVVKNLVENKKYAEKISSLALPEIVFQRVKIEEGVEVDARIILPYNFRKDKKYPVLFHVYGEPWGQVSTDTQVGLWNIMMSQKGFVIVDMDNRGTPCLKGSAWRQSIYGKVGMINVKDQAKAAQKLLDGNHYMDRERVSVWGWSGGGSMTLNLMFRYPEIYGTGVAVAAVSDQLIYDNIYQERYMGLPQENKKPFIEGSPVTHAKNLKGNLMIVHGTGDDNVHYQSAELLINELIKHNKKFDMMSYPNRSHGIYEGKNTRKHLYTLLTDYFMEHSFPGRNK